MRDILTVTLNPALDLATSVSHIEPNVKLRCASPEIDPGGGGLNVARAIHQLGGTARCFVSLGGDTGQTLLHLLKARGLTPVVHDAPGETRQSLAVNDLSSNDQYRFMLPGPEWHRQDIASARQAIREACGTDGFLVLSGSGPTGSSPALYAHICQDLADTEVRVILDTSGPVLAHLAAGQDKPPFVLRMDHVEAEELARKPLARREDSADFAARLIRRGAAELVIVARGADGSVMVSETGRWHVTAAPVKVDSMVGAGDSFVGAFTMGVAMGKDPLEALRWGAAAASAAVSTPGTQLCHREDFDALLPECVISEI